MPRTSRENDINYLRHMLDFAQKAVAFNKGRNRSDLDSDEMLAMATIHLIEMIGEASHSVSEPFQEKYRDIPWHNITGTRNRLAHGYVDVNLDVIWAIVMKDLPSLVKQIRFILKQEGPLDKRGE